jgi:hypothetical protein
MGARASCVALPQASHAARTREVKIDNPRTPFSLIVMHSTRHAHLGSFPTSVMKSSTSFSRVRDCLSGSSPILRTSTTTDINEGYICHSFSKAGSKKAGG